MPGNLFSFLVLFLRIERQGFWVICIINRNGEGCLVKANEIVSQGFKFAVTSIENIELCNDVLSLYVSEWHKTRSWSQDHILRVLVWAWTQPWFYLVFPQSQISRQFILSYFKTSQDHYFKATVYRLEPNRYTIFSGQYQCQWFAGATFYCVSISVGLALHLVLTHSQPLKVLVSSGSW